MRPLDDVFSSSSSTRPKSRPSSITSRSPSPGIRLGAGGGGHAHGISGGTTAGAGGLTFFLTEENNFGVHSMSESNISTSQSISRSPPLPAPTTAPTTTTSSGSIDAEIIDKPDDDSGNTGSFDTDTTMYNDSLKKMDKTPESNVVSAIPSNVFERSHIHTPSIGSNISPTISTPSSPQHNLSSSAISDDSELDISSHHEEEPSPTDSISSSFPQLVMPRVNMPRRKAFTEKGRTMGKLKVMVVGDSGIYTSSMIY
jgi:hypothetical protein